MEGRDDLAFSRVMDRFDEFSSKMRAAGVGEDLRASPALGELLLEMESTSGQGLVGDPTGRSPGDAAHVDLASSGPGVFYNLQTLEEGDRMSVLYEDGSETQFRVVARVTYEKDELPLDVIFSREGPSVLTLITCGGAFNSNISRYDSNVVVYAVPDTGSELPAGSSL